MKGERVSYSLKIGQAFLYDAKHSCISISVRRQRFADKNLFGVEIYDEM